MLPEPDVGYLTPQRTRSHEPNQAPHSHPRRQESLTVKTPIPLNRIIQIALVVEDMDLAVDTWCALFGVERPTIQVRRSPGDGSEHYRGEVAKYGLKFAVIECPERGLVIELHEPDQSPSTFREFLDKHGNGVHHLGFEVGDQRDAIVTDLLGNGHAVRNLGYYPGSSWTIIDCEASLGVNLNIKPIA